MVPLGFKQSNIAVKVAGLNTFLGPVRKLQKSTVSFVMTVCPSVRMGELCSHWTDFHEI